MKKIILSLLASGLIFTAYSQSAPGKWMIKKVGISLGHDMDMIKDMDADFMIGTGINTENSVFLNRDFPAQDLYGGFCENPHIRGFVTLGLPGEDRFNVEFDVNAIFNRWDGLYYWDHNGSYDHLSINSESNEVNLGMTINRQLNVTRWFNIYGGVGTNAGYAFGQDLYIYGSGTAQADNNLDRSTSDIWMADPYMESLQESYDVTDAFTQRLFATTGFGIELFRRVELGLHFTRGIGYRKHFGSAAKTVNLHSAALRANWLLGSTKCCTKKVVSY